MFTLEELRKMNKQELNAEINELSKSVFKISFEVKTGASKANSEIGKLKKYRARIRTVEKELQSNEEKKFKSQKKV